MTAQEVVKPTEAMDAFDYADQQEADEMADEDALYVEAEAEEVRCALALFRALKRNFDEYCAVKVDGELNWTITKPHTPGALLAALDTNEPPAFVEAAKPLVARLDKWEAGNAAKNWRPPDSKRVEVRCGDLRQLRSAMQSARVGCSVCGALDPDDNVFCSAGFHAPQLQSARPTEGVKPTEDAYALLERVAGILLAPNFLLSESVARKAATVLQTALSNTIPGDAEGLVERAKAMVDRLRGTVYDENSVRAPYLKLVNPDGPEAADLITQLLAGRDR